MKKLIFSVYDLKAKAFLQPFFLPSVEIAERAMVDCLLSPDHNFSKYTADFTLFHLGTYNESTGELENDKYSLGSLVEIKGKNQSVIEDHFARISNPIDPFKKLQEESE